MGNTKSDVNAKSKSIENSNKDQVLTGNIQVIPDCKYRAKKVYNCVGLGVYSGSYYATKVTHTISKDGYKVSIEVSKSSGISGGVLNSGEQNTADAGDNNNNNNNNNGKPKEVIFNVDKRDGTVGITTPWDE